MLTNNCTNKSLHHAYLALNDRHFLLKIGPNVAIHLIDALLYLTNMITHCSRVVLVSRKVQYTSRCVQSKARVAGYPCLAWSSQSLCTCIYNVFHQSYTPLLVSKQDFDVVAALQSSLKSLLFGCWDAGTGYICIYETSRRFRLIFINMYISTSVLHNRSVYAQGQDCPSLLLFVFSVFHRPTRLLVVSRVLQRVSQRLCLWQARSYPP